MVAKAFLNVLTLAALCFLLAGCGSGDGGGNSVVINGVPVGTNLKSVTEERKLTAPHVAGTGIDVSTEVGSVEVAADPSAKVVSVTAKLNAFGETEEEARVRLKEVKVKVDRRSDQVLEIRCEYPKEQKVHGGCSFVVHVPQAKGVKIRSGNGSITIKQLGGAADVDTAVGAITVTEQAGKVTAHTGNGRIQVTKPAGDIKLTSDVGSVTAHEAASAVNARSGNGTIEIRKAGGDVDAVTDVGSVSVRDADGYVTASSGNGTVTVANAKGKIHAKSSVGSVKLEQVSGQVEAETGNGAVMYAPAAGSAAAFTLKTDVGSVTVQLPASAAGSIDAATDVGSVTIKGSRKPRSVSGDRASKKIVLTDDGPSSRIHSGNGTITITLD